MRKHVPPADGTNTSTLQTITTRHVEPEVGLVTGPKFVPRALDDANLEFIELQVGPKETQISPAEVCGTPDLRKPLTLRTCYRRDV